MAVLALLVAGYAVAILLIPGFGLLGVLWLGTTLAAYVSIRARDQVISWLCWVPNLIVAEWIILRPAGRGGPVVGQLILEIGS